MRNPDCDYSDTTQNLYNLGEYHHHHHNYHYYTYISRAAQLQPLLFVTLFFLCLSSPPSFFSADILPKALF